VALSESEVLGNETEILADLKHLVNVPGVEFKVRRVRVEDGRVLLDLAVLKDGEPIYGDDLQLIADLILADIKVIAWLRDVTTAVAVKDSNSKSENRHVWFFKRHLVRSMSSAVIACSFAMMFLCLTLKRYHKGKKLLIPALLATSILAASFFLGAFDLKGELVYVQPVLFIFGMCVLYG
jgi:hypothetical protein